MPERAADGPCDLVVVYGTLRSGTGWRERLGVAHQLEPVGPVRIEGSLYELAWYPGLVLDGGGSVVAEVLRLLDPAVLDALDRFEGYDPAHHGAGEYRREQIDVELDGVVLTAWVYLLAGRPVGRPRVDGGDWLAHLAVQDHARRSGTGPP